MAQTELGTQLFILSILTSSESALTATHCREKLLTEVESCTHKPVGVNKYLEGGLAAWPFSKTAVGSPMAYDFPSHGLLTKCTVPGREAFLWSSPASQSDSS